jgi:hypothetical protein
MSTSEDETEYFKFTREEMNRREQLFKVGDED